MGFFNATRRDDEEKSREDGTGQATLLRASLARTQPLPLNFSFYTNVAGQYAFTELLANEEFSLGGISFGRGYDFDELSGDNGIGGTAEVRYSGPLDLPYLEAVQFFSFFEGGGSGTVATAKTTPSPRPAAAFACFRLAKCCSNSRRRSR